MMMTMMMMDVVRRMKCRDIMKILFVMDMNLDLRMRMMMEE